MKAPTVTLTKLFSLLAVTLVLTGCAGMAERFDWPAPIDRPNAGARVEGTETLVGGEDALAPDALEARVMPITPHAASGITGSELSPSGPSVRSAVGFDQLALPAFIDAVFSQTLGLNVVMDPTIADRDDQVTMRTGGERDFEALFALTREVLSSYGVGVSFDGETVRVAPDEALAAEVPRVIRSRALPSVPSALRPIFQYVPIENVDAALMRTWLQNSFDPVKLRLAIIQQTNALSMLALPNEIAPVLEAIELLDQPRFAGRASLRLRPAYWNAKALTAELIKLLTAEGFSIGETTNSAILLVPIERINAIIVFAENDTNLAHVRRWAEELDQPTGGDPVQSVFIYRVRNTTAESLSSVIEGVLDDGRVLTSSAGEGRDDKDDDDDDRGSDGGGARIVLDEDRNAILFVGRAEDYARIRPILEALDQAPLETLIEVTIAEVTLNDAEALGVEWALQFGSGAFDNALSTDSLGIGSIGLNYALLDSRSQTQAILNAFRRDNRVSIISAPRLLARSGGTASVNIGTEIPIITAQSRDANLQNSGTTQLVEQVQYRRTGTLLSVEPIVHSGDRIDLKISQELSEAQENDVSDVSSPVILNRQVETELSLRDGQTVLLGGLISENNSDTTTGVPLLKDIPVLGNLFRSQSISNRKTELLIFITPYVIASAEESAAIAEQFRQRMQEWPPLKNSLDW